jgi:glutamate carboxypeptidase
MTSSLMPASLSHLRREVERRLPAFLEELEAIVEIESGSYTKTGVDAVVTWMADRLSRLGAAVARHPHDTLGDTLVATFQDGTAGPTTLLIGHADTVFEPGFLARRPFEVQGDRILGPGVSDMKSGLLSGLYAIEALQAVWGTDWLLGGRLVYVVNPDEEIGSPSSSPLIRQAAQSADAAFVMESARANGDIVSSRKGLVDLRATVRGRSSHAGVAPEQGRSATLEAAHKTVALHALNGRWPTVTVNVGRVVGGTRPNIVAETCVMDIDLRARTGGEMDEAEATIREILRSSTVADVTTEVEKLVDWAPMEKSEGSARLVETALAIAAELGFELRDAATGGGSDANTTSSLGVPTLDGLGPIGGNDHTDEEYIEAGSIAPRTTLLAALVRSASERAPAAVADDE